jgi:hypothetical protein
VTGALTVLLATFLAGAFVLVPAPGSRVYACSIGTLPDQRAAVLSSFDGSDLVLVGTVLTERPVGMIGNYQAFESNVKPEAVLAGDAPAGNLVVRQLGFVAADCTGGPRLEEGEKVLLALDRRLTGFSSGGLPGYIWVMHNFLGKVRIDGDQAVSQYAEAGVPLGDPPSLLRDAAAALNSDDRALQAALTAAATPVPKDSPGTRWLAIGVLAAAVVALAAGVLMLNRSAKTGPR